MDRISEQLGEVSAMIAEARDAVASGEMVDLSEIQARVQNICLEIQDAPPIESADSEKLITNMIEDLSALANELEEQRNKLGSEVIRTAARKSRDPSGGNS